jgi:kumamolisin
MREAPAGTERLGPLDPAQPVSFTVVLRRRAPLPPGLVEGAATVGPEELARRYGADPADVARVRAAFEAAGLTVARVHPGSRRVTCTGPARAVNALLRTELSAARGTDASGRRVEHRVRDGALHLPADLDGVVLAVLGTETAPHGRPLLRAVPHAEGGAAAVPPVSYDPHFLADSVYAFPPGSAGKGTTAALLEFGGGYEQADLDAYFAGLGIAPPAVRPVTVAGGRNAPGKDASADGEVQLDIEVLGAAAPGAALTVVFAPGTEQGYVEAVSEAVHATPTPTVVAISWGAPENTWSPQAVAALEEALADAAAMGVTVCAAAGDAGSTDGERDGAQHLDYPGSSPHVLSVGGTTLRTPGPGESVWNALPEGGATGGGVSAAHPLPGWQRTAGVPGEGRGVPDVAAVADPATGYRVSVGGKPTTLGGTSAAAPLWAALVCRVAESLGRPLGLLPPLLYAGTAPAAPTDGFTDITAGANGAYTAGTGWDPCTGLGTPHGTGLLRRLAAGAGPVVPPPAPRTP